MQVYVERPRCGVAASGTGLLTFRHVAAHEEPLLWLPDAIAWAIGRGGDWRRRAEPLVEKVVELAGKVRELLASGWG